MGAPLGATNKSSFAWEAIFKSIQRTPIRILSIGHCYFSKRTLTECKLIYETYFSQVDLNCTLFMLGSCEVALLIDTFTNDSR